jgi:hypothetical protein
MGCPSPIWPTRVPRPGSDSGEVLWEDSAGITVCIKNTGPVPVDPASYVYHRPLETALASYHAGP